MNEKYHIIQRRKPKQARAIKKYEAILDACTQVLASSHYKKATVLELSLESGVAVATIYQYFENKDAIFVAWINRVIDQVLSLVANMKVSMKEQGISVYVDNLMLGALLAFKHYRSSAHQLFTGTPDALSTQIVATMENKTVSMLLVLFHEELEQIDDENFEFKLRVLVKMINGYLLQSIMNDQHPIRAHEEAKQLAAIVKLYLSSLGIK